MLQSIRENLKGTIAIIIVGLMMIPLVLFGVDSLFLQNSSAGQAAEVNGEAITEQNLLRAVRMQKQQLLERFGDQAPAGLISDERLREPVLARLIDRELLRQTAEKNGMTVADAALDALIVSTEQFRRDGRFSPELYTQILRNMGYSPAEYKNLLLEDSVVSQLASGVTASAAASESDLTALIRLTQQSRSFLSLTLPYENEASEVVISEDEVKTYYEQNQSQFMAPETVSVEYIELSIDQLADNVFIDDSQVDAQYQAEMSAFQSTEQRQIAHILIEDGEQAEAKITEVSERLAAGDVFADIARELSDDLGSSELGGDLGFTDGATFPEEFESEVAQLEVGQVSKPVQTDAGTHFIKLLAVEVTEPPSFETSEDRIRDALATAEAESQFFELLNELPDATYNAVSLIDAAEGLGLEAQVSDSFDRNGGEGVLSNNQVLAAVFSDDVLHQGLSSDTIEVSDNHVVVVKLKEHQPSHVKPFTMVSSDIEEILTREAAVAELTARAEQLLADLSTGTTIEALANANQLEWEAYADVNRTSAEVSAELIDHVFRLPKPDKQPVNSFVTLPSGDVVVLQFTVVKPGAFPDIEPEQRVALRQRLAQEYGNLEMVSFQNALTNSSTIELY